MNGILSEPLRLLFVMTLAVYLAITANRFITFIIRTVIIKRNKRVLSMGKHYQPQTPKMKPLGFVKGAATPKFCQHCARLVTDFYEFSDGSIKCEEGHV